MNPRDDIPSLQAWYRDHRPSEWVSALDAEISRRGRDAVWISRVSAPALEARARELESAASHGPLWGVPFAIKDNIDFAGLPTTAACPKYAYSPAEHAPVVQRLLEAGGIAVGKTNLDQFATGLVGVRSPYGTPVNPYNPAYVPGGSSSGSAVAVAAGLCHFALGTDTAGSGRVPAAFNRLAGLKPTRGLLSTRGVVPACRSLDCVSIFARTVNDAARVFSVATAFDPLDPFSRRAAPPPLPIPAMPRIAVPRSDQLEFFGNQDAAQLFRDAVTRWDKLGAHVTEIDYHPFRRAAQLLYEGPWVTERLVALQSFLETNPGDFHPVTRKIIEQGRNWLGADVFKSSYELAALRQEADRVWEQADVLMTPTAGTAYTVAAVEADPLRLNSQLGYYTNHMNLLDQCGLALPAGFLPGGVPWGITLAAPAFHDDRLLRWGTLFAEEPSPSLALTTPEPLTRVAVCGAHLSGLPLNHQLLDLGARLIKATRTAPAYRFYALPGTTPPKPGLLRVGSGGSAIEVEVWQLSLSAFGRFVSAIPAPLGIGRIELTDGDSAQGFLCEAHAVAGARDISSFGGWRAYLNTGR